MRDQECVEFLQWCLPRMGLRWAGFRKVRGTVCKRVRRRIRALGLADTRAYRAYLAANPGEWSHLDAFCRIPISRFYRDRGVFATIESTLLPALAARAAAGGDRTVRCWSAGCASGEEPYTLAILWHCGLQEKYPEVTLDIVATDADRVMLERAKRGCYGDGSLRELPAPYRACGFLDRDGLHCVRPDLKAAVRFERQDIREAMPPGPFDLILCRNLVLTYFHAAMQDTCLQHITRRLATGGYLIVGAHERLPAGMQRHYAACDARPVYRRLDDAAARSDAC